MDSSLAETLRQMHGPGLLLCHFLKYFSLPLQLFSPPKTISARKTGCQYEQQSISPAYTCTDLQKQFTLKPRMLIVVLRVHFADIICYLHAWEAVNGEQTLCHRARVRINIAALGLKKICS